MIRTSLRRGAGLGLILLATLPVYRLLGADGTGLAGRITVDLVDAQAALLWTGALVVLGVALLAGMLLRGAALAGPLARVRRVVEWPPAPGVALGAGALGTGLGALFSARVLERRPPLMDGVVQLLHARYMATGSLAADPAVWGPHWHVPNSVLTEAGWVSHFPPGHVTLLALGFVAGGVWLVGPVLLGATAFFSVLVGERLLPRNPGLGRFGGVLVAAGPLLLAQAGGFMNHATAAAFGTAAIYFGLRARAPGGGLRWAAAAGVAVAVVLATRPLAGAVFAAVIVGGIWLPGEGAGGPRGSPARLRGPGLRAAVAAAAGSPVVAGLLLYHTRFFGAPLRFGYHASYGPAAGPGFGRDPWGNAYGPLEALGYTSADLVALNLNLLEAPVPVVVLVGAFLLLAPRLRREERILALWAGLPVVANVLYWHHGYFMGPRMLAEFAPGWILLTTVAADRLVRMCPDRGPPAVRFSPRAAFAGMLAAGLVGMAILGPARLQSAGAPEGRAPLPPPSGQDGAALVFVHGSWHARIAAILSTRGLRVDVVDAALRQNPICLVHLHTLALERDGPPFGRARELAPGRPLRALDLEPRAYAYAPEVRVGGGPPVRLAPDEPLAPECERELLADRHGVVEAAALVWAGDLPGIERGRPMYVRDLGPERNREILERYPHREPRAYLVLEEGEPPVTLAYDEAMRLLWHE